MKTELFEKYLKPEIFEKIELISKSCNFDFYSYARYDEERDYNELKELLAELDNYLDTIERTIRNLKNSNYEVVAFESDDEDYSKDFLNLIVDETLIKKLKEIDDFNAQNGITESITLLSKTYPFSEITIYLGNGTNANSIYYDRITAPCAARDELEKPLQDNSMDLFEQENIDNLMQQAPAQETDEVAQESIEQDNATQWIIKFNECDEIVPIFDNQKVTAELLNTIKELDIKTTNLHNGYYKFFFEKIENGQVIKKIRFDIGGWEKTEIDFGFYELMALELSEAIETPTTEENSEIVEAPRTDETLKALNTILLNDKYELNSQETIEEKAKETAKALFKKIDKEAIENIVNEHIEDLKKEFFASDGEEAPESTPTAEEVQENVKDLLKSYVKDEVIEILDDEQASDLLTTLERINSVIAKFSKDEQSSKLERLKQEKAAALNDWASYSVNNAGGQPMNDKKNNRSFYNGLERAENRIRSLDEQIEKQESIEARKREKKAGYNKNGGLLLTIDNIDRIRLEIEKAAQGQSIYSATTIRKYKKALIELEKQLEATENNHNEKLDELIASGKLNQWKKQPTIFFIKGYRKLAIKMLENGSFEIAKKYAPKDDKEKKAIENILNQLAA